MFRHFSNQDSTGLFDCTDGHHDHNRLRAVIGAFAINEELTHMTMADIASMAWHYFYLLLDTVSFFASLPIVNPCMIMLNTTMI